MDSGKDFLAQLQPHLPWITLVGVLLLFALLRVSRKALRLRIDEIGYYWLRERGPLLWFWFNAPGVILHELSHAIMLLLFYPFGFRITSITLFRVKPMPMRKVKGRVVRSRGRQSLQLGEVQYVRPQGRIMSYVGDGFSGVAPLLGGIAMFAFLYWAATGYQLWDFPFNAQWDLQWRRPDWPWWTLLITPYLILTVTSELWPSRQDWYGARWLLFGVSMALILIVGIIYLQFNHIVNYPLLLQLATSIAAHVDFALLVLIGLDLLFLLLAELILYVARR
jgi:hypothetical protein